MFYEICFGQLSTLMVDFVDQPDGFLFLRLLGAEPTVNAIWAYLSARDSRQKKWSSKVTITVPGQSYPPRVAMENKVQYRTLRSKLPSGLVDLAMIHPRLTVAEDKPQGFYLLTYETGCPPEFFPRLNTCLSIPLKPEWADWLWHKGQLTHARWTIEQRRVYQGSQPVEVEELVETHNQPITRLDSLGQAACYQVACDGSDKDTWLEIIRAQLGLALVLRPGPHSGSGQCFEGHGWTVMSTADGWLLQQGREAVLQAPTRNYLLTQARDTLGLNLIIEEKTA